MVEKITYRNSSNGYTVAEIKNGSENTTVVGILPFLNEGESAVFYGKYIVHATYGRQFAADAFEKKTPKDTASILRYLSSGVIRGIGPATASKIVEKFGEESLNVIREQPKLLASIRGISEEKALSISAEYEKQYGVRDIMLMLSKYGVTPETCVNIYRKYGGKSAESIRANPYILCDDGINLRFETAEDIASDNGIDQNSELRVCAGLEYVLRKNLLNGHTCLPRDKFIKTACRLLECSDSTAEICCDRLADCFRISRVDIKGTEYLAIPDYCAAERFIAARLYAVKDNVTGPSSVEPLEIDNVENRLGIKFETLQRQAINDAFRYGILVLTGGPGTGKTTTLNAIINLFENRDLEIELAAPTGRAAKRITELTGREAKTIHRLLETEWGEGDKPSFSRNEKNPLNCDVIIIDEASMIDSLLFESLLKALRLSCRIILVGDADQLPSIGAGNVLNDILTADVFPSIRLKKVFRQAGSSLIVTNAHAVINNEKADITSRDSDFFFLRRQDKYSVVQTVTELCCERLPAAYGFDAVKDIQILCPSRKLETGTVTLNNIIQDNLNPMKKGAPQITYKGFHFRMGDKVMQTKNNYDMQYRRDSGELGNGVFNGDVGYITDLDPRGEIVTVRFDDRVATYYAEEIGQLEPAYAITVHKSQGSEFDCVIIPLFDVPSKLRYKNLLYTAITRAKKLLVVVGSETVWNEMAANDRKTLRYTMLSEFLKETNSYEFI